MRSKCLKFFLLFTAFCLSAVFTFSFSHGAMASPTDVLDYSITTSDYGSDMGVGGSLQTQSQQIEPNFHSISKIFIHNVDNVSGNGYIQVYKYDGTLVGTSDYIDHSSMADGGIWVNFSTTVSVDPGSVYYFYQNSSSWYIYTHDYRNDSKPNLKYYQWNGTSFDSRWTNGIGASLIFDLYYDSSSETYCGDSVCNGSETFNTCVQDCSQSAVNYVGGSHSDALLGGYYQIPVYWNVCGDYGNINSASITFTPDDTGVRQDYAIWAVKPKTEFIGPQKCSGIIYYDGYVPIDSTATSGLITLTLYGTSTTPLLNINTVPFTVSLSEENPGAYIVPTYSQNVDINSGASTTPIRFSYKMGQLAWAGTSICLYKDDGTGSGLGVSTGLCSTVTATSSYSVINYPIATSTDFFSGYLGSDTFTTLRSSNIGILFSGLATDQNGIVCLPPVLDVSHDCDHLESTSSISCSLAKGFHVIGYYSFVPSCSSQNAFKDSYAIFKRAFPFNAFFDITDTIDTAIASSTASPTTTFGLPFINSHSTSSNKFYIIPVVSSSSLSNAIGSDNANTFHLTLGFIIWILTALTVYFTVRKI